MPILDRDFDCSATNVRPGSRLSNNQTQNRVCPDYRASHFRNSQRSSLIACPSNTSAQACENVAVEIFRVREISGAGRALVPLCKPPGKTNAPILPKTTSRNGGMGPGGSRQSTTGDLPGSPNFSALCSTGWRTPDRNVSLPFENVKQTPVCVCGVFGKHTN